MRKIAYREALREALREEMHRDSSVFLLGEDIGRYWGKRMSAYRLVTLLSEDFLRQRQIRRGD
jgi:pyruvate dehydrogenase E1 component beta subunit